MTDTELLAALEMKHVKSSQFKDGDLLIIRSPDSVDWDVVQTIQTRLQELTGKRIAVAGMGPDDSFEFIEHSDAVALLNKIIASKS